MFAILIIVMLVGLFAVFGGAFAAGSKMFPVDDND
jgi:hypothetical protein